MLLQTSSEASEASEVSLAALSALARSIRRCCAGAEVAAAAVVAEEAKAKVIAANKQTRVVEIIFSVGWLVGCGWLLLWSFWWIWKWGSNVHIQWVYSQPQPLQMSLMNGEFDGEKKQKKTEIRLIFVSGVTKFVVSTRLLIGCGFQNVVWLAETPTDPAKKNPEIQRSSEKLVWCLKFGRMDLMEF
jgi:hypothetical protein